MLPPNIEHQPLDIAATVGGRLNPYITPEAARHIQALPVRFQWAARVLATSTREQLRALGLDVGALSSAMTLGATPQRVTEPSARAFRHGLHIAGIPRTGRVAA